MLKLTFRYLNKVNFVYFSSTLKKSLCPVHPRTVFSSNQPRNFASTVFATHENEAEADKAYLVRIQNDPDAFGPEAPGPEAIDEDDVQEEQYINTERQSGKRLSTKQYADLIKALIAKQKIKEAIDVVEVRMIREDRVKPNNYLYNLLLGACGRVGYTKKAFALYNEMKRRGLEIHAAAYTALFNACANSPWSEDGLKRAHHLHNIMIEKRYEPNDSNYNAMIKAYGRWGDISTAFALVDEMIDRRIALKDDTLNFLLQACISDSAAGFRHALLVWRKFYAKDIKPSTFSYNLMLRATRDCNLGDLNATKDVLSRILPKHDLFVQIEEKQKQIQDASSENDENVICNRSALVESEICGGRLNVDEIGMISEVNRPNLLRQTPFFGDTVLVDEITKAEDRLLLLGGVENFLAQMRQHDCAPNLKTYTLLLNCMPSTMSAEKQLLQIMKKDRVRPDLEFFNMLIKKRSLRFDYEGARSVLELIEKAGFLPDLITYGILALGCKTRQEAESFLNEMTSAKYRLNVEILGAMLQQSTYHSDFGYVLFVMERCVEENIPPNAKFMEHLEKFYRKCKTMSNDPECARAKSRSFLKGYQIFRMRYKTWKKQAVQEVETHPWQQFRQPVETDVRHFKDVEKSSRFKGRHLSLFRQKQIPSKLVSTAAKPRWRYSNKGNEENTRQFHRNRNDSNDHKSHGKFTNSSRFKSQNSHKGIKFERKTIEDSF